MTSHHRLTLGGIVLSGADLPDTAYSFSVAADDLTWGEAEPIERTIRTLLQDGAVTVTDGYNDRTATFLVHIEGPDSQALARGEAALVAELGKPNELVWTPPDGWGPPTVFEAFTSSMDHLADDLREMTQSERVYRVRLVCHPTARAESPIGVAAITAPDVTPTSTVIDTGTALTNWSATNSDTILADAGTYLTASGGTSGVLREFKWTGSVDLTSTPFLSIDTGGLFLATELRTNGVVAEAVASYAVSGGVRHVWLVDNPGSTTTISFRFLVQGVYSGFPLPFSNLLRWDLLPLVGTGRQKLRTIDVQGSTRTQGSLELASASSLGSVLVYTWPSSGSSYSPPLRVHRTGGATVAADTARVSGSRENITTAASEFEVPAASLVAGTYLLVAIMNSSNDSANTIAWSAQAQVGGNDVGPLLEGERTIAFGSNYAAYRYVALGRMVLPPTDLSDVSSGVVALTIDGTAVGNGNLSLDEAWLLNTTIGAATIVECGTGTAAAGGPSRRLWLDTPTTDRPRPGIFRGHSDDRSDAFFAGSSVQSWGVHEFLPPQVNVLTVTSGATDTEASFAYYARFHTHAYDPDGD